MKFNFKIQQYQTEAVEAVARVFSGQPHYNVLRGSEMASDSVPTNFDQIFAFISPYFVRKGNVI